MNVTLLRSKYIRKTESLLDVNFSSDLDYRLQANCHDLPARLRLIEEPRKCLQGLAFEIQDRTTISFLVNNLLGLDLKSPLAFSSPLSLHNMV